MWLTLGCNAGLRRILKTKIKHNRITKNASMQKESQDNGNSLKQGPKIDFIEW